MFLFESVIVYTIFPTAFFGAETPMTALFGYVTLLEALNENAPRVLVTFKVASVEFSL